MGLWIEGAVATKVAQGGYGGGGYGCASPCGELGRVLRETRGHWIPVRASRGYVGLGATISPMHP